MESSVTTADTVVGVKPKKQSSKPKDKEQASSSEAIRENYKIKQIIGK